LIEIEPARDQHVREGVGCKAAAPGPQIPGYRRGTQWASPVFQAAFHRLLCTVWWHARWIGQVLTVVIAIFFYACSRLFRKLGRFYGPLRRKGYVSMADYFCITTLGCTALAQACGDATQHECELFTRALAETTPLDVHEFLCKAGLETYVRSCLGFGIYNLDDLLNDDVSTPLARKSRRSREKIKRRRRGGGDREEDDAGTGSFLSILLWLLVFASKCPRDLFFARAFSHHSCYRWTCSWRSST